MVTSWVIDASIATKLLLAEPDSEAVRAFLDKASAETRLLAPALLRYEVGNAATKGRQVPLGLDADIAKALAIVDHVEPTEVAAHCGPLSYYDASYLALAIEHKAGLLTADERLRKAAKKHGVPVGP